MLMTTTFSHSGPYGDETVASQTCFSSRNKNAFVTRDEEVKERKVEVIRDKKWKLRKNSTNGSVKKNDSKKYEKSQQNEF